MKTTRIAVTLLAPVAFAAVISGCGADYIGPTDLGSDAVLVDDTVDDVPVTDIADTGLDVREFDTIVDDVAEDTSVAPDAVDVILIEDIPETDTNPPFLAERLGWAWAVSPDDGAPTQVPMKHLVSPEGKLTGQFGDIWNCLREDGGPVEQMSWDGVNYDIQLCHYKQTVVPGDDGTYLHVEPPVSSRDGNDAFAEGHTYYSLNRVHDYFADTFGHIDNDRSLFVAVNVSFQILGSPGWMGLDNAAFMPDASYGFMGFNMHDGEMLAFGQGRSIDYCSDASVVFHEYAHFIAGTNRFSLNTGDSYGFSADPPGLNEGFADYFASTILDMAVLGEYALGDDSRDLSQFKRCPDDYIGESHTDGRIWSSALWEIRVTLGAEIADQIAYGTLVGAGPVTTFAEAAAIMLDVAADVSPENLEAVRGILESHNLVSCSRVLDYGTDLGNKGYYQPGTLDSYAYEFQSTVAGTFQHRIVVPEGKTGFVAYFRAEDMYGYDSAPEVKLMVKRGDESIAWSYAGRAMSDADKSFVAKRMNNQDVSFTVAGSCVTPGVYHIQLVNKAEYSVIAKLNSVTFLDSSEELTWDGCTWPDDPPVVEETPDVIETDMYESDTAQTDVINTDAVGSDTAD